MRMQKTLTTSCIWSAAPIASLACAKVGTRVTTITGAVLVSGGFLISIFASSVVFLYISMGLIVGNETSASAATAAITATVTSSLCLRNGLCAAVPVLLRGHNAVLQKEARHGLRNRTFGHGFDLCPRTVHPAASRSVCLARYPSLCRVPK